MELKKLASWGAAATLGFVCTACGTSSPTSSHAASAVTFQGKTVTIIDNFSAGGSNDLLQRLIAKYLPQYLPGHPTVIVQNMPGAGGEIGTNDVYQAQPNGLTVGGLSDPVTPVLVKSPGVKYSLSRLQWIGAVADSNVIYVRTNTGVTSVAALKHAKVPLVFGGLGPTSSFDMGMRAFLGTLGVSYKYVTGYPGPAQEIQAFRTGEDNVELEGASGYNTLIKPMVQEKLALPIAQEGIWGTKGTDQPDTAVKQLHLPTVWSALTSALGHSPSGPYAEILKWVLISNNMTRSEVLPPKTPSSIVNTFRTAFQHVMSNPAFVKASIKELGGIPEYRNGSQVAPLINTLTQGLQQDPQAATLMDQMANGKSH